MVVAGRPGPSYGLSSAVPSVVSPSYSAAPSQVEDEHDSVANAVNVALTVLPVGAISTVLQLTLPGYALV